MEEDMKKPNFFLVGAPKSGTTSMADYLGQHPEIFMCQRKEIHFFSSDLCCKEVPLTQEKYLSYFSEATDEKRVGEASVWYLYSECAARQIKAFCPHASIMVMLRNPVDMLHSLHSQLLYNCGEDIVDFEKALEAEADRKQGLRIPSTTNRPHGLFYRAVARYTEQVQRYLNVFGRENVHVIIFDDLRNNIEKVWKETLWFLDVNSNCRVEFGVLNSNKVVRTKILGRYLATIPQVVPKLCRGIVPSPVRRRLVYLYRRIHQLNAQYESRPPLEPELGRRLKVEFALEVEQLSELLGRDLTYWTR